MPLNLHRLAYQLACDAIYGAAAQTGHVPPTAYSDHAIERAAGHIEAVALDLGRPTGTVWFRDEELMG